jgi:hypothetical protein
MKTILKMAVIIAIALTQFGCSEKVEPANEGKIQFKMSNPVAQKFFKQKRENPDLTGERTETYTLSFKVCIGDVWVSKNKVVAGEADEPEDWVRLTGNTNYDLKLFEDYTFPEVTIPAGEYKSVKINFKNVFYRYAVLASDSTTTYELLETMGSYSAPCDANDTSSWVPYNYFSLDGNHKLVDGKYVLEVPNEKLTGFTIADGKTAVVTWRLGAGVEEPCTTTLVDKNGNRKYDCGIDDMEFYCPPEVETMWDFIVEYQ